MEHATIYKSVKVSALTKTVELITVNISHNFFHKGTKFAAGLCSLIPIPFVKLILCSVLYECLCVFNKQTPEAFNWAVG